MYSFDYRVSSLALCPDLVDPVNGTVMMTGKSVGDTATYSCNNGFSLSGVHMVTCQGDGEWSDSPPTCVAFRMCILIFVMWHTHQGSVKWVYL